MAAVELSGTWRTTASPAAVWEVVSDLERWREWWPALSAVRPAAGGSGPLPDRAELVFDTVVGSIVVPVQVRSADPQDRLVVVSDGGGFEGKGALTLRDGEEGADIAYEFRMGARKLWLKPVEAVLRGAGLSSGRRRMQEAGDRLAALAGGEPRTHDV